MGREGETIGQIGEFGLIGRIEGLVGKTERRGSLGIGDDAALLSPSQGCQIVLSCDVMVEGRHFRKDLMTPEETGARAAAVSMSDLAAMGAAPVSSIISLGLKQETTVDWVEGFYRGFQGMADRFNAEILGGNITAVEENCFIDVSVVGEVPTGKALLRSGASAGDAILVTGFPGSSAAGLAVLLRDDEEKTEFPSLCSRYIAPVPRIEAGILLREMGVLSAAIDVSDGLAGDLSHILDASGVGASLSSDLLPIDPELNEYVSRHGGSTIELAIGPSDDYELLFSCPPGEVEFVIQSIEEAGLPVARIGTMTERSGELELVEGPNKSRRLEASGWDHFDQ